MLVRTFPGSYPEKKLDEIVSRDFRQFVDGEFRKTYFLLPSADYVMEGLPCLDFWFGVFAVVEVRVWLKRGEKDFGGYLFDLPQIEENGWSTTLKEPEFLGYHYFVLSPEDIGYKSWQPIPLILLKGLLDGERKPEGVTISAASAIDTTYKIQKFKEEIEVPDSFADYLRSVGSIDAMVSMGIISDKVAGIVKAELSELKVGQRALSQEDVPTHKGSLKEKAFELFGKGKRPRDPEVKELDIKPNTAYRYYQAWKRGQSRV